MEHLKLLFEAEKGDLVTKTEIRFGLFGLGRDLLLVVTGGEAHIGAVALTDRLAPAGFHEMKITHHREDVVARLIAERLKTACHKEILVTVGIHFDDITKSEIDQIMRYCEDLLKETEQFITATFKSDSGYR